MHDWFCQIELIESICQKKVGLRENSISIFSDCALLIFNLYNIKPEIHKERYIQ